MPQDAETITSDVTMMLIRHLVVDRGLPAEEVLRAMLGQVLAAMSSEYGHAVSLRVCDSARDLLARQAEGVDPHVH